MHITKWKKTIWKGCLLYDSNHITFWKRQNCGDSERISGCQRLEGGDRWTGGAQRICSTVKYSVWYANDGYMSLYICLKPLNLQPRVNPIVNHRLWVIMTCQCRFANYNKCPVWRGRLMAGEAVRVGGEGHYGKSLYILLNFAVNLKLS